MLSPRRLLWWPPSSLLLAFALMSHVARAKGDIMCSSGVSTDICLPDNYSKLQLPYTEGVNAVGVSVHIEDVLEINEKDQTITFAGYFIVDWKDPRLTVRDSRRNWSKRSKPTSSEVTSSKPRSYESSSKPYNKWRVTPTTSAEPRTSKPTSSSPRMVKMNLDVVKDLWMPDVLIHNLKSFRVMEVLSPNAGLWIDTEKNVMYSQAAQITFRCSMIFDMFPLDTQECNFEVGSYSYDASQMLFITKEYGYYTPNQKKPLDFQILIKKLYPLDRQLVGGAGFEMVLTRFMSTFIITYFFLPSGLLVILSWISFLIPMDKLVGRLGLLVMLFLALIIIFMTATTKTPKTEGLTVIEVWMLVCILFVFAALIQYAAILFMKRKYVSGQNMVNLKVVSKDEVLEKCSDNQGDQAVAMQQLAQKYWRIDKFFLISFPVLFMVFNIIYWLALLH